MKRPIGFKVLPHDWAGLVTLEFSVFSKDPVNTVRYRSPLKSREFDLYVPRELFGDQTHPERIWVTLEKPQGTRTIQGFSQLPHRWAGPPSTIEFTAYDRSLVNSVRYRSTLKTLHFDLYIPREVFGDQPEPPWVWATFELPEAG